MFGNFIYFILVLLIYLTYQPSDEPGLSGAESLLLSLLLTLAFTAFTHLSFRRIQRRIGSLPFSRLDAEFHSAVLRCSVLAVGVFALDIYAFSLPTVVSGLPGLSRVPTLQALLFLLLFIGHLCVVWGFAFGVYRRLYHPDFTRREYVVSHISFSVPVLLPWLLISLLSDMLNALPLEAPRAFLASTEGQLAYFSVFLVVVVVLGPLLIKTFWRCSPLEESPHRRRIERLCRRAGMAYADILHWPLFGGRMITAGVMGVVRRFRYILVTPSLLGLLDPEEVDAVIAHEIGHVKRRHLHFYLLFFAGYLLLSYVTFDLVLYVMIFAEPVWRFIRDSGVNQSTAASVAFSVMIIGVFLVYFRFVFGFFMRNFERQADGYVYALFDSAGPLISTLEKIALTSGQSAERPNWHHYSIRERIEFLLRCEASRAWIRRHDAKVRRAIAVYIAALALLAAAGYQMNMGAVGARLSDHLFETIVRRAIEQSPGNPELHALLGDLSFRRENLSEARQAYETALALKPDNPTVMNNLAWLLATSPDERLREPLRALALARQAADLEASPHILDTLAECYYVNGRYAEAAEAGRRALALAGGDRSHYERQLRKFAAALEEAPRD